VQQPSPLPRRLLATRFPAIAPGEAPKPAVDAWPSRTGSGRNDGLELRGVVDATSSTAAQQVVAEESMPQHAFLLKKENQCHANETSASVCKTDASDSTHTAQLSLPTRKDVAAVHQQEDASTVVASIVRDSAILVSEASAVAKGTHTQDIAEGFAEVVRVETREDFWRVQIEAIYRRRNPHKLAEVPQLLAKHRGHEASLYCKICRRYDLNPKLLYADPKSWEAEDKDVKDDDDDTNCQAGNLSVEVNTAMAGNSSVSAPLGGRADQGISIFGRPDSTSERMPGGNSLFGVTGIGSTQSPGPSGGFLFGGSIGKSFSDAGQTREDAFPASSTSGTSIFGASGVSTGTSIFGFAPSASSATNGSSSGLASPGFSSLDAGNAVAGVFGPGNSKINFSSSSSGSSNIFREGLQGNSSTVVEGSVSAKSTLASVVAPGDCPGQADKHTSGSAQEDGTRPPPSISSLFGSPPPEGQSWGNIFGLPPKAGGIFSSQSNAAAPLFGLPGISSQAGTKHALENGEDNEDDETLQPRRKADKEVMAKRRIVRARCTRPATAEAVPTSLGFPAQVQSATPPQLSQPALEVKETIPSLAAESAEVVVAATDGGTSAAGGSLFAGMAAAGRKDSGSNCDDQPLQVTPSSAEDKQGGGEKLSEGEKPVAIESKYDFWKVQIEAIYRRRNPHKMNDVPKLLEKYKDTEVTLYRKVCLRYDLDSNKLYADPKAWEGEEKDVKDDDDEATGTTEGGTCGSGAVSFGTGSIFGSHASSGGLFGSPSSGSSSLFAIQAPHTSGSSSSLFGGANSGAPLFGGAGATSGNSGSIFGSSIFGGNSSSSIFGTGATKSSSNGLSIFGGVSQGQGSAETTTMGTASSGGLFSSSSSSSSGGLFGGGISFNLVASPCSSGNSSSTGSSLFAFGAGASAAGASSASFGVSGFSATSNSLTTGRSGLFGATEPGQSGAGFAGSAGSSSLFGGGGMADEGASKRKRRLA